MKLLYLSIGSVLASSCSSKLPSLAKACGKDYKAHCSTANKLNLVSVLQCGKANEASLQPECLAEIQKDFSATYACTEDLSTYCPDFGRLSPWQWGGNDNDDDDDDDSRDTRHGKPPGVVPDHPVNLPKPDPPLPESNLNTNATNIMIEKPEEEASSSAEDYVDYFTWDYYSNTDFNDQPVTPTTTTGSTGAMDALHSKKSRSEPADNRKCFRTNYAAFSSSCRAAIRDQWAAQQAAKGVQNITGSPTADEAYDMMAPPMASAGKWQKMSRTLFYIALGFFVCTLITCLCCCCRRCKKRRAARVVPSEGVQEVALTPLPEAVVVPMAAPTRFVPLATPVPAVVRPQTPAYVPYTGEGLSAYVPLAQPVHV